jgi:DNA topoisomerase-2
MHLFDVNGTIKKYDTPLEIMEEFYTIRYEIYKKRKQHELNILEYQLKLISYKVKFILLIVEKKLIVNNKKKSDIENELEKLKFPKFGKNNDDTNKEIGTSYNYLLGMPIYNLTMEKIEELKNQKEEKEIEYEQLKNTTIENLWLNELNKLEKEYDKWLSHRIKMDNYDNKIGKKSKKSKI